jgi:hypothetical protein
MYADVTINLTRMEFEEFNQLLASGGMCFVESSRETFPECTFMGRHQPELLYISGVLNSSHRPKRCALMFSSNRLTVRITTGRDAKVTEDVKRTFAEHIARAIPR